MPGAALPDGLGAPRLLEPELIPVVVPDFTLLVCILPGFILLAPVPTLPSLVAPGAGCAGSVWADVIAVAPRNEVMTRAIASLGRMIISGAGSVMRESELASGICVPLCVRLDFPRSNSARGGQRVATGWNMSDIVPNRQVEHLAGGCLITDATVARPVQIPPNCSNKYKFCLLKRPWCAPVCLAGGVVPWHTFNLASPLELPLEGAT